MDPDHISKALGAAAQINVNTDGLSLLQRTGEKWAERRNCGCCWIYLAKQPLIAPCEEHLRLLEP